MVRGRIPGEFEQVVLLTLAGFDGEASGRDVYDVITTTLGRDVSIAAVHITLGRLSDKGWVACSTRELDPGEGGKPRRHYRLAPEGATVLRDQLDQIERLRGRARRHPLLGGDA